MFVRSRWTNVALAASLMAFGACSENDPVAVIPPGAAVITTDITANRTFYAETTYTLRGFIHVTNGATLTIMPGTKIVGDTTAHPVTAAKGAALFIMRGAKISAVGTAVSPIVFTSIMAPGSRKPGDWGGLVIIGNGIINRTCPVNVEGTGTRADTVSGGNYFVSYCGGANNADNSGELRYVRVEYAGFAPVTDQELNSFTFAGVGSGTKLSYLQSLAGLDDAFEWFGGAVDADHIVAYEPLDDGFDMSEGYVGRIQHAIYLKSTVLTPRAGSGSPATDPQGVENDGCNGTGCGSAFNSTPLTVPVLANFTLVGSNDVATSGASGGFGMVLRRGTGGYYVNGLIARFPRGIFGVRDADTYARAGSTTTPNLATADLAIRNVTMLESPAIVFQAGQQPAFDLAGNAIVSSASTAASVFTAFPATITTATTETAFDWTPVAASAPTAAGLATFTGKLATATATTSVTGNVFAGTAYTGAAAPGGTKWWAGWTIYAQQ
jgi:hypothetical protein